MESSLSDLTQLKVLGKVMNVSPLQDTHSKDTVAGYNDATKGVIHYNNTHPYNVQVETILHELIHVVDYEGQVGLEERQVHILASILHQILVDNPHYTVRFLLGERLASD